MIVDDDTITGYLGHLLGRSEPGAVLHTLMVATAEPGHRSALGLVESDKLHNSVYAIAPDDTVDADQFIAKVIMNAAIEAHTAGRVILFAGLAIEAHKALLPEDDEVSENRARRLQADRKLHEHPTAVEVTRLYAAASDGRRWVGEHYLTGPMAGTIIGPEVRVGSLANDEREPQHRLVRLLVRPGAAGRSR